ncbi:hypothetical protein niasHT_009790 [Heterodera trifolii]|uniref:Uncharacterized protein n=1 Tax=Heterodera trifolii TaxID=157864 RepID=A0ABD2ME09_9BILA
MNENSCNSSVLEQQMFYSRSNSMGTQQRIQHQQQQNGQREEQQRGHEQFQQRIEHAQNCGGTTATALTRTISNELANNSTSSCLQRQQQHQQVGKIN